MSKEPTVSVSSVMPDNFAPDPEAQFIDRQKFVSIFAVSGMALFALAGGIAFWRIQSYQQLVPADRFAAGVKIAGIDIGGLHPDEAKSKIRDWAIRQGNQAITFRAPQSDRRWNIPLSEAGGRFEIDRALETAFQIGRNATLWQQIAQGSRPFASDISPVFLLNEAALDRQIKKIADAVHRPAENARARVSDDGKVTLAAPEKKGISLDVAATKNALLKNGIEGLRSGAAISLVVREERPRITASDLGRMGTLLSSFTTDYSSSTPERRYNVELAASKINGTILAPDEEFSYNRTVGPREAAQGWKNALMFEDGEVVPGMGGGVCQVSSTLYNAVLQANLKVKERQNHSIKVHYVSPGRDATVVYGALDFRFVNTTPAPILLLARMKHRELTFNIYGAPPEKKERVEIVSGPYRYNDGGGITVATYKLIHHEDGKTTREYLHTDVYRSPQPRHTHERRS